MLEKKNAVTISFYFERVSIVQLLKSEAEEANDRCVWWNKSHIIFLDVVSWQHHSSQDPRGQLTTQNVYNANISVKFFANECTINIRTMIKWNLRIFFTFFLQKCCDNLRVKSTFLPKKYTVEWMYRQMNIEFTSFWSKLPLVFNKTRKRIHYSVFFLLYNFTHRSADNRLWIIEKFAFLYIVIVLRTINISRKLFFAAIYDANLRFMAVAYFIQATECDEVRKGKSNFFLNGFRYRWHIFSEITCIEPRL